MGVDGHTDERSSEGCGDDDRGAIGIWCVGVHCVISRLLIMSGRSSAMWLMLVVVEVSVA